MQVDFPQVVTDLKTCVLELRSSTVFYRNSAMYDRIGQHKKPSISYYPFAIIVIDINSTGSLNEKIILYNDLRPL